MECYVEFDIPDKRNFRDLCRVFNLVKHAKNFGQPQDDKFWLEAFPKYSTQRFFFYEDDLKPDFETVPLGEFTWHFYSMIQVLQIDYDIEYLDCQSTGHAKGILKYMPYGYPYGGMDPIVNFIRSFGCIPRKIDDGTSLYKIHFLENGDFSITDLHHPNRQNSAEKRFESSKLLHQFFKRSNGIRPYPETENRGKSLLGKIESFFRSMVG